MGKYISILIIILLITLTSCVVPNNPSNQDIYYRVSFDSNFGSFVEAQDVKEGECAQKPTNPTKENFVFVYWMLNEIEYDFKTPVTSHITLVAKWEEAGVHTHYYTSEVIEPTCTTKGYTNYICTCGDNYIDNYVDELGHDEVYHEAKAPTETEIGWDAYITCNRCTYSTYKELPVTGSTSIEIYEKDGKKFFNFGSYPQTHVNDTVLINELNKLTTVNSRGYYEYNGSEYAKVTTKAQPYLSLDYKYSTGKTVEYGVIEWFKVEPIVWRILSNNNDGTYQVLSEYILDQAQYYNNTSNRTIDGQTIYPNNYKYSDIRGFLNNEFLNAAFKTNEQSLIIVSEVDNSASTTYSSSNPYACENTYDKIYLLSFQDMLNTSYGFSSETDRRALVTDYAKAMGVWWNTSPYYNMGFWWLRSPIDDNSLNALVVNYYGYMDGNSSVDSSDSGVRPAFAIAKS